VDLFLYRHASRSRKRNRHCYSIAIAEYDSQIQSTLRQILKGLNCAMGL